jgi:hypothetical protein
MGPQVTGTDWGLLIPAVVGVLGAVTAWLKARTAQQSAASAHARLDALGPAAPK